MSPRTFQADPGRGLPAVVLPADAVSVGRVAALGTPRLLWARTGDEVHRVAIPGPWTVMVVGDRVLARAPLADAFLAEEGLDLNRDPRLRRGRDLQVRRSPGGPWELPGLELPAGARWARDLFPWPAGRGLTWSDSGFAYRWNLVDPPVATGPARPWPPEPEPRKPERPPAEAFAGRGRIAGLRVVAQRTAGPLVEGWLADGVRVFDQASSGSS